MLVELHGHTVPFLKMCDVESLEAFQTEGAAVIQCDRAAVSRDIRLRLCRIGNGVAAVGCDAYLASHRGTPAHEILRCKTRVAL